MNDEPVDASAWSPEDASSANEETRARDADRAWIGSFVDELGRSGPGAYQRLAQSERAWRGRYCLMIASLGHLPSLAWGASLAPDHLGSEAEMQALVDATDDSEIAATLRANRIRVEDLRVG